MKILHTADIHIGVENYGKIDPETRTSTRLSDFLRSFDEIVSFAIHKLVKKNKIETNREIFFIFTFKE